MPHPHQPQPTIDLDPEAVIARQEAMIQAGTHAIIAEKLARDAVYHQDERDRYVRPGTRIETVV